ncbi:T9SS type A sorting domain-containing protein [Pseudobacter ginsenosidimutans]|uniref:Putative secreted protein (Por secretion system target) n=1 Tax=Pseudobacter ginsenosidimutans TaxID=661488 RepID=A0A4Q7N056_9BACT|nr:T9SS type A sorting domain-containing protein [Pseudobacter ginsenosidimutans]QEC43556.1 T9SS type A sorting domain-containing protein [Pseudobacter ginsenosidimutans]RZS74950.1 putative secreted protein (Por secretion system target) [Pseudobacter ginsenosidimutans]
MTNHLPLIAFGKRLFITVMVLMLVLTGMAQQWTNVTRFGTSNGFETGRGVCTDASGNVYYVGQFSAGTDFDPGPGNTTLTPVGIYDNFITKYNSSGVFQWAKQCGGASQDFAVGITTDGTDVYIVGNFHTAATFDAISLSSNGGADIFVAKLSGSNGAFQWAQHYGAGSSDNGHSICTDGAGNLYITGTFTGNATIGAFPLTPTGGGGSDLLIAKLSASNGAILWAVNGGSSNATDGTASTICYHPGLTEVIVGAAYNAANATYGGFNLTNTGGNDMALLELNANTGVFLQAFGFGGTDANDDEIAGVCYDPVTTDIFLTGFYKGGLTFTGTPALTNAGMGDFFVSRYNPVTNAFTWAVSGGSSGEERSYGICSNGAGSVYIAGYYSASMSFGAVNLTAVTAAPEVLVGGLSVENGDKQWALSASGNDATLADQARAISTGGPMGKIAVTGQFAGAASFGPFNFNAAGNVDIFLAQLGSAPVLTVATTDPNCENGCDGSATANVSGGVAPYTYAWSSGSGTAATENNLCAGGYDLTVTDNIGQVVAKSFTISLPPVSIANEGADNAAFNISSSNTWIANSACRLIARVVPNGTSPIGGPTSAFVKFEPLVPVFPLVTGQPFVQRHYQITPASGASSATGRVTLYFTQAEFNAFNAHPGATLQLPTNSTDAAGKANLRIGKYPGSSSDNSGLPGTYTGAVEVIDPNDADIVFNATENRWEISFDVEGFSGFIVQTSSAPLPVTWLRVTAFLDAQQKAQLRWEVQEANVENYLVERSTDGVGYATISTIISQGDGEHSYSFNESTSHTGKVYYRIRQVDKDGRASYSQIMIVNNQQGGTVTVYPNPSGGVMNLNITDRSLMNTVARLYNSDGRELQQINIRETVTRISLGNYVKGTYFLRLSNGETLKLIRK